MLWAIFGLITVVLIATTMIDLGRSDTLEDAELSKSTVFIALLLIVLGLSREFMNTWLTYYLT